jgi:hypothetical protein
VWDRLFGTFEPEVEPVRYGLTKNVTTFHPVRVAFHEWIAIARDDVEFMAYRRFHVAYWGSRRARGRHPPRHVPC